jgi:serine/threonine protein kinase
MPTLEEEQKFERYRINRWLGNGVSGESYEAEDTLLLRKVNLKLIQPWTILLDDARRQFFREMQGIGRLNHPYLAAVLDYGECAGKLYVARQYVLSGSLLSPEGRTRFKPPLMIEDAFHYTLQLAQALQYIHTQGYFHGSLTLANTLILHRASSQREPDCTPLLVSDVGLANFVRRFGQTLKSPLPITAAPEQLGQRVTPASDQFSLAVLLYLWLSGRPPYLGSAEEIAEQKLSETIIPLTFFNRQVTPPQEQIIRRALSVYPEDRYPSIIAFAEALMATLTTQISDNQMQDIIPQTEIPFDDTLEVHAESTLQLLTHSTEKREHFAPAEVEAQAQAVPDAETIIENIPDTEPLISYEPDTKTLLPLQAQMGTGSANQPQLPAEPTPQPQPTPERPLEPLPTPLPDPLPEPAPEPLPQPAPEPAPQPAPEPLPEPAPEPLPQPEPDIFQPIPPSKPELPSIPQTPLPETSTELETAMFEVMLQPLMPSKVSLTTAAYLLIAAPGEEPELLDLGQQEITIGRAGSDTIHLNSPTVSRHHAVLKYEEQHYVLFDLRSANGVYVNGQRLSSEQGYLLKDGDSIIIGDYELVFGLDM